MRKERCAAAACRLDLRHHYIREQVHAKNLTIHRMCWDRYAWGVLYACMCVLVAVSASSSMACAHIHACKTPQAYVAVQQATKVPSAAYATLQALFRKDGCNMQIASLGCTGVQINIGATCTDDMGIIRYTVQQ